METRKRQILRNLLISINRKVASSNFYMLNISEDWRDNCEAEDRAVNMAGNMADTADSGEVHLMRPYESIIGFPRHQPYRQDPRGAPQTLEHYHPDLRYSGYCTVLLQHMVLEIFELESWTIMHGNWHRRLSQPSFAEWRWKRTSNRCYEGAELSP